MATKSDWILERWSRDSNSWDCVYVPGCEKFSVNNYFGKEWCRDGVYRVRNRADNDHKEFWLVEDGETDEIHEELALELMGEGTQLTETGGYMHQTTAEQDLTPPFYDEELGKWGEWVRSDDVDPFESVQEILDLYSTNGENIGIEDGAYRQVDSAGVVAFYFVISKDGRKCEGYVTDQECREALAEAMKAGEICWRDGELMAYPLKAPFDVEVLGIGGWAIDEEGDDLGTIEASLVSARALVGKDGHTYRIVDQNDVVVEYWRDGQRYESEDDLNESRGVVKLSAARQALAEARNVDDVVDLMDKVEAVRVIARRRNMGLDVQNDAAELRVRCEHQLGQWLQDMDKHPGGRPKQETTEAGEGVNEEPEKEIPTLADLGLNHKQSSKFQKLAAIPEDDLDEYFAKAREKGQEITTSGALATVKKPTQTQTTPPEERKKPIQLYPYNQAPKMYKDALHMMVTDNGDFYVLVWPKGSNQDLELHTTIERPIGARELHRMGDVYFQPSPVHLDNGDVVTVGVDLHSILADSVNLSTRFDQAMIACDNADDGRAVLRDIENAIATIQLSVGIAPITGTLFPFCTQGFGVIRPKEWKSLVSQVRNISKEKAELMEDIIKQGQEAHDYFGKKLQYKATLERLTGDDEEAPPLTRISPEAVEEEADAEPVGV